MAENFSDESTSGLSAFEQKKSNSCKKFTKISLEKIEAFKLFEIKIFFLN
jgi:hypothetical protein